MCFVLRCMVLFRLAGAHNSVGAAAQWLRQDGPITRTTRGGAEALTVIDSFATARTVYVLATTTLFNTQETLKKADVKHWFRCRYAANDTRPATRASVNRPFAGDRRRWCSSSATSRASASTAR